MRDLSLHILDLIENSIRAKATAVTITISEDLMRDTLELSIEDNGRGLSVTPEQALDPFYTSKSGKKTGLGLSLLQASAERAGGTMKLTRSQLGGLCVTASMQISNLDRAPFGNLPATISSVICTNPEIDLCCRFRSGNGESIVRTLDVIDQLPAEERCGLTAARLMASKVRIELEKLHCYKDSTTLD